MYNQLFPNRVKMTFKSLKDTYMYIKNNLKLIQRRQHLNYLRNRDSINKNTS